MVNEVRWLTPSKRETIDIFAYATNITIFIDIFTSTVVFENKSIQINFYFFPKTRLLLKSNILLIFTLYLENYYVE